MRVCTRSNGVSKASVNPEQHDAINRMIIVSWAKGLSLNTTQIDPLRILLLYRQQPTTIEIECTEHQRGTNRFLHNWRAHTTVSTHYNSVPQLQVVESFVI